MKSEQGSLTVFGLFITLGLLFTLAIVANSNSLYLQQRQLKNIADALTLDLADLLQHSDSELVQQSALGELDLLNTSGSQITLEQVVIDEPKVGVTLCAGPKLTFNLWLPLSDVCANSTATSYLMPNFGK